MQLKSHNAPYEIVMERIYFPLLLSKHLFKRVNYAKNCIKLDFQKKKLFTNQCTPDNVTLACSEVKGLCFFAVIICNELARPLKGGRWHWNEPFIFWILNGQRSYMVSEETLPFKGNIIFMYDKAVADFHAKKICTSNVFADFFCNQNLNQEDHDVAV